MDQFHDGISHTFPCLGAPPGFRGWSSCLACPVRSIRPMEAAVTVAFREIVTSDARWVFYAADLDGDGDVDVLHASHSADKIAWYENVDRHGTFGTRQIVTTSDRADSVYATDVDGDGDNDILSTESGTIAWYRNLDQYGRNLGGKGSFGERC